MGRLFIKPARVLVTLLLLLAAAPVLAASTQALQWLDAQRQADGTYDTADSVALEPQVLTEILLARAAHGDDLTAIPASIWDRFSAWAEADTEFLAGWIRAAAAAGHDHAGPLSELRVRQNDDGGFADQPGGSSTVLATAFALLALHATGVDTSSVLAPAVGFLTSRARSGGGWAVGTNEATVYTSALALQALAPLAGRYNLTATIEPAVTFLLSKRTGSGALASDWETAHALLGLMPVLADPGRYGATLRALADAQTPQGSWSDDPYATALAVRALYLAERLSDPQTSPIPPAPTHGTIGGTLVNDANGAPLAGAQISVLERPELHTLSGPTGLFELSLPGGEPLTLVYRASGYLQATQAVMLAAGGVTNVGTVRLPPMPDHGRLFGFVSAQDTGTALSTAVLRLSGDIVLDIPVAGDGAFDVALPGGNYLVSVEAPGYHSMSGNLSLQVGQAIRFAPVLVPDSEPVDDTPAAVTGVVQNAETGEPLAGVMVEAPGAGLAMLTDATGRFHFEELPAGSYTFVLSRDGYHGASIMVDLVPAVTADLGAIGLPPVEEPPAFSTVLGVVVHADDGAPVPGARVSAEGHSTLTDVQGRFRLEGISQQEFTVLAEADGFASRVYAIQLPQPGTLQLSVALEPYDTVPAAVTGVVQNAETGEPLAGVMVEAPAAGLGMLTDAEGRFHFEELAAGSYTFVLSRDGYHGASVMVSLVSSVTADLGAIGLPPIEEPSGFSTVLGVVVRSDSGAPVPGARLSAGAQSTTTDAQGRFRLEGIPQHDFTVLAAADGFASREYPIQLPEPGTFQLSVALEPYDRGGLRLSGLRAAQPAYEAHTEASLELDLSNTAQLSQTVRLYLEVSDPSGASLGEFPITPVMREEGSLDAAHVTVEPGAQLTERFSWFTEAHPPGDYELSLRAYQAFNGELLGERSLVLRILETRRIELVSVRPNPLYLTQGAVEEVGFDVLVQHRSNVSFPLAVTFQLSDPQGQALHTGTATLELHPNQTNRLEALAGPVVEAALPGAHPIQVFDTAGYEPTVIHGQPLYVAPGTRVEIRQHRSPGVIAPDGSYPIDIEIKLEGKDQ